MKPDRKPQLMFKNGAVHSIDGRPLSRTELLAIAKKEVPEDD